MTKPCQDSIADELNRQAEYARKIEATESELASFMRKRTWYQLAGQARGQFHGQNRAPHSGAYGVGSAETLPARESNPSASTPHATT